MRGIQPGPSTRVVDGKVFRAELQASFRGAKYEFGIRLAS
jgi:hypothetical protein